MKAKLIRECEGSPDVYGREDNGKPKRLPAGTVIDHPDAFKLVQAGMAEPADDECEAAHGMTPRQIKAAQKYQDVVAQGLQGKGPHEDDEPATVKRKRNAE